jgi:hypothetical protein
MASLAYAEHGKVRPTCCQRTIRVRELPSLVSLKMDSTKRLFQPTLRLWKNIGDRMEDTNARSG